MFSKLHRGRPRLTASELWVVAGVLSVLLGILVITGHSHSINLSSRLASHGSHPSASFWSWGNQRTYSTQDRPDLPPPVIGPGEHPIAALLRQGESRWEALLARQSTSLEEAVAEYKRRYGRNPPKGFDLWYRWSTERGLRLVDEFDRIDRDLAPFWGLSPQQIESRRQELHDSESNRIFLLTVRNGVVGDDPGAGSTQFWELNHLYFKLFSDFSEYLPDLNMTVNLQDSPLIFTSYEERQRLIEAGKRGECTGSCVAPDEEEIEVTQELVAKEPIPYSWQDLLTACPPDAPAHRFEADALGEDTYPEHVQHEADARYQLSAEQGAFVFDNVKESDACYNPKISRLHGNFVKSSLHERIKRGRLYPLFSWSTHYHASDITIPTTYRFDFSTHDAVPWEKKIPKITWRGDLTGSPFDVTADRFSTQRYRLWRMVSEQFARWPLLLTLVERGRPAFRMSSIIAGKILPKLSNVHPTNSSTHFSPHDHVGQGHAEAWGYGEHQSSSERDQHKMMLDVDGHGWSARYRELLRTSSPVMKATTYFEAITDWLVPWYHYIPLSYDYHEYFSLLTYFLGFEEAGQPAHDRELKLMGERAREWTYTDGHWDQHLSYLFRVALEWARICSDDRASMDFVIS